MKLSKFYLMVLENLVLREVKKWGQVPVLAWYGGNSLAVLSMRFNHVI